MWLAFHAFWLYLIGWLVGWLWLPRPLIEADYSTLLYSAEEELLGARIAPDGQWRFPPAWIPRCCWQLRPKCWETRQ